MSESYSVSLFDTRPPPRSTRTTTLVPDTERVRSRVNPYFAVHQEQEMPDLDANAPFLRSDEEQRLNRKALGFRAGIIVLRVVAAIFVYNSATSGAEELRRPAEEQVVSPELPRELPRSPPPTEVGGSSVGERVCQYV